MLVQICIGLSEVGVSDSLYCVQYEHVCLRLHRLLFIRLLGLKGNCTFCSLVLETLRRQDDIHLTALKLNLNLAKFLS